MLKTKANKVGPIVALDLTIVSIGDSRTSPFEKRRNDTIHGRVGQSYSVSGLIFHNI